MKEMTIRQLNRLDDKPMFSVKDPISALTHFIGFIASIILTPLIFTKASFSGSSLAGLTALYIYRISVSLLFAASTTYHTFLLPARPARILKKFDHMSIFVMIAGTYTPVCLMLMKPEDGLPLLIAVWSVAIIGMAVKAFWVYCPKYVSSIMYIGMGWACLSVLPQIIHGLGSGFWWLLAGGVFYTVGGVIYALKPNLFPKEETTGFGNHELFHLFVLAGSLCHYLLMLGTITLLG